MEGHLAIGETDLIRPVAIKVLLICGILSSLLYVAADILASMRWQGYSYTSQAISELMTIGAPTRPLIRVARFANQRTNSPEASCSFIIE